jgi:DNA-directed RNA polymerase specialized sigma24 family protein
MADTETYGRHAYGDEDGDDAYGVRPYAVTGGRTRSSSTELPLEALVQGLGAAAVGQTPEKRRILELTATQYLSVAELSALIHLPVGVVRILVSDLVDEQQVRVHGLTSSSSNYTPATTLSVLESVLNGISSL